MLSVLKRTVSSRRFFEYPQYLMYVKMIYVQCFFLLSGAMTKNNIQYFAYDIQV